MDSHVYYYKLSGYELTIAGEDDFSDGVTFVRKEKLEEYKAAKEAEEAGRRAEAAKQKEEAAKAAAEEAKKKAEAAKKEEAQRLEKLSAYFTDSRNGQKYRTVKIGGKTWMAENLNYQTGNSLCYNNDNTNCKKYGRLYDWNTVRTACPTGWHLPSREEWGALAKAVGGTGKYGEVGTAGKALKSTIGWENNGNGADQYGFSAMPGGASANGRFNGVGNMGNWWAADGKKGDKPWNRIIIGDDDSLIDFFDPDFGKSMNMSVRCVAD